jgi:hypothetical protein
MTFRHNRATLGILAVAVVASIAFGGAPAYAATAKEKCYSGPGNCSVTKYHPRKGTVWVTVNSIGNDENALFGWDVRKGNKLKCTGEIREGWKAKKFKCKNMPKGKLKLILPYQKKASIKMAW